jgi:hypothetical protein
MWTSFGVAAATAVAGAVTLGITWQRKQALGCDSSGSCDKGSGADKRELGTLADWATAGFVVAGVALATGVTIWLVDGGEDDASTGAVGRGETVVLSVGPAGVNLAGSF